MDDVVSPTRSRRSIYIDDHLWDTLADLGRRSDRSVANLVRQAVMEFIVASGATGHLPTTRLVLDRPSAVSFNPVPKPGRKR